MSVGTGLTQESPPASTRLDVLLPKAPNAQQRMEEGKTKFPSFFLSLSRLLLGISAGLVPNFILPWEQLAEVTGLCSSIFGVFCVLRTLCAHHDTASAQGAARGMFHYRLERKAKIYLGYFYAVTAQPAA